MRRASAFMSMTSSTCATGTPEAEARALSIRSEIGAAKFDRKRPSLLTKRSAFGPDLPPIFFGERNLVAGQHDFREMLREITLQVHLDAHDLEVAGPRGLAAHEKRQAPPPTTHTHKHDMNPVALQQG